MTRAVAGRQPKGDGGTAGSGAGIGAGVGTARGRRASRPGLAAYAAHERDSRGRRVSEPPAAGRGLFQRDRDRVIHSTAFRRLEYKTQVFINHEGDLYRTRLTHSLEVAQIARSIARVLRLNEDLVEAIALAHDLGHTPFGHAGQDALNQCMADHGGFEHNLQSLRVVDALEQRYAAFDGLNLCFETREGILKHCSKRHARLLGELGERFLLGHRPSLEAQVANLADEIAYGNHDVDDGLRSGLISLEQLDRVDLFRRHADAVRALHPGIEPRRLATETVRRMINELVSDLEAESLARIESSGVGSVEEVREAPALVGFSAPMRRDADQLKRFLYRNLYRHPQVEARMERAAAVLRALFEGLKQSPDRLPAAHAERFQQIGLRAVADYVAGMTDRYALAEYRRLTGSEAPDL